MNEAETRCRIIDKQLRLAGWKLDDPSQVVSELGLFLTNKSGQSGEYRTGYDAHQFSDYGFMLKSCPGMILETKRTSKDAEAGQEQGLQYAQVSQGLFGGPLPFVMYSNGHDTFFWESDFYPPSKTYGFPTYDDLEWLAQRRDTRKPLSVELINPKIAGRDYQIAAIRTILEALEAKRRRLLLVMATGTGKTRVAAALTDVLLRARWAKRVLFLVDRIPLLEQARDAFKEHLPDEPLWPTPREKRFVREGRRLYVSTYPTMLNLIQGGDTPSSYLSPFFFDLIIADESHRSIYDVYKNVLDYFQAIKIGLTATPRDHIEHDTFKLFDCDQRDPTFAYTYEEAVRHVPPYLCNFEVLKVRSKFQLEGIKGGTLPPAVRKKLIAEGKDPDDINFEGTDLERKVTNSGTNALIVREFMEGCIRDPTGTLPGKTIIFAITKGHARRLQALFDAMYPEHKGKLARVLVSEDSRVYGKGGLLDQFRTKDMPRIAISVDLMDTGVDVREVVNLVFAKPVYSYVKFWQMIGRGTRVLDPEIIRSWCPDKDKFRIIDCWGNFDFFKMKPKGVEPSSQVPLPVRLFLARLDKLDAATVAKRPDVVELIKEDLFADVSSLPQRNVVVVDHAKELARIEPPAFWENLTADSIAYLRTVIAPLMRVRSDTNFKAMRFELEVVELGTALLAKNPEAFSAIRESVVQQVEELPLTVNLVAREQPLIEAVLHEDWWRTPTDEKLRDLSARLSPLMQYRQEDRKAIMRLDIDDLLAIKETIEFGPGHERLTSSVYRDRVEARVRAMVGENPVLRKIRDGQAITDTELKRLADLLAKEDPEITEEHLRKAYDHRTAHFIQFIRHILGLERLEAWPATVSRAFTDFIAAHTTMTPLQIQFLRTLETYILQTGKIEKQALVGDPFTRIHPNGIRGVFNPAEIEEVLRFARRLVA